MKRKIDLTQPPLRKNIPWRMMLGAVILCFSTSVNVLAQSNTFLTLTELQNIQTQINQLENKLANPMNAANPTAVTDINTRISLLQAILDYNVLGLQLNNPAEGNPSAFEASLAWQEWQQQQEDQQVIDQENQLVQLQSTKVFQQFELDQQNALNQEPVSTSPIAPPGSYSYDPTKQ